MSGRQLKAAATVVAGLGILAVSWILPALWKLRLLRESDAARAGVAALRDATLRFYQDYGVWPTDRRCFPPDCRFGAGLANREVINVLCAVDGPGNLGHAMNPNRTVYFEPPEFRLHQGGVDARNEYRDPWGMSYQVVLDADFSGICEVENSIYHGQIGVGVLVWSCGPDRRSDTQDDILSWSP